MTRLVLFTILVSVEDTHLVENLVSTWVEVVGSILVSQNFRQVPTLQFSCFDNRVKLFLGLMPPNTAIDVQNSPHTTIMLEVFRSTVVQWTECLSSIQVINWECLVISTWSRLCEVFNFRPQVVILLVGH